MKCLAFMRIYHIEYGARHVRWMNWMQCGLVPSVPLPPTLSLFVLVPLLRSFRAVCGNAAGTWLCVCSVITLQIYLKQFCSVEQRMVQRLLLLLHSSWNLILAKQLRNKRNFEIEIRRIFAFPPNAICEISECNRIWNCFVSVYLFLATI